VQEPVLQDYNTDGSHVSPEQEAMQPIAGTGFAVTEEDDDDGDIVAGPTVEAQVDLAKTPSKCFNDYND
jgi:hypothetical protein